jgi:hypothetical protein
MMHEPLFSWIFRRETKRRGDCGSVRGAVAAGWLGAVVLAAGWARAQEVVVPASILSSTAATDYYPAANLINGGGLSAVPTAGNLATVTHASAGTSSTWVTAAGGTDWFAVAKPPPVLTLGLAREFSLSALVVWGYPVVTTPNNNEAKTFVAEFSVDGGATWGGAVTLTHARTAQASEVLTFSPRRANAVRLTITDNHYGTAGASGGERIGLGEIRFLGTTEIPRHPMIRVPAGWVDFGSHPDDPGVVERRLVVRNEGLDLPLELGPVTLAGPEAALYRIDAVPGPIAAGASGEIVLTYRPGGGTGRAVASLQIGSNDAATPMLEVALLGAVDDGALAAPEPPVFSAPSGTFGEAFSLEVTTPTPGALVLFTTDGGVPGVDPSRLWSGPLAVEHTTRVRAVAVAAGGRMSAVREAGYTRLSAALRARTSPLPILVLENFGAGPVPDKRWTTSTQTGAGLKQVRRQPIRMSLHDRAPATGRAALLGPSTLSSRGGLRVRGAFSSTWSPQPYSLETWDDQDQDAAIAPLGLPPESDWVLYHPHRDYDVTMIFNTYIWELSRRTGRYAPAFRHVEVYLNTDGGDLEPADRRGLYALVEEVKRDPNRLDFEPLSADGTTGGWLHSINRMDPEPEDGYPAPNGATSPQFFRTPGPNRQLQTVANNPAQVGDDIPRQYNAFINFENPGGYDITAVQRAAIEGWFKEFEAVLYDNARWRDPVAGYRQYLNTRDFIDYFQLLNLARQGDGLLLSMFPWVSSDRRQLHMGPMWDFNNGAYHLSGAANTTLYFRQDQLWYPRLFADPDFLMEYTDRWFELRRGPYAGPALTAVADTLAADITTEMAVAQGVSAASWASRLTSMKNFLVQRANWIDTQYVRPPVLSPASGPVTAPVDVTVTHHASATGTLYVTTDGTDPRAPGGAPRGTVFTAPLTLTQSAVIQARTQTATGRWSGLATGTFITGTPASAHTLVISEIHYNPPGAGDTAEFLELFNISAGALDLTGARFDRGIQFAFPAGTTLAPGERALVVARAADFAGLPGVRVLGEFEDGSRLDNGGEWLRLLAWDGAVITEFSWNDKAPWPVAPDGDGPSLSLVAPATRPDPADPRHWRSSTVAGGTPGGSDTRSFVGDPLGDADGDGLPNLCAHALGLALPGDGSRLPSIKTENGRLIVLIPFDPAAEDVEILPEWSADLLVWEPVAALLPAPERLEDAGGRGWLRFDSGSQAGTPHGFLRVRVRLR